MQLIAKRKDGLSIFAAVAERGERYLCPSCGGELLLRGGHHRQLHFYHPKRSPDCLHEGKGMAHLQAQLRLQALLPPGEGLLEHPFTSIGRIADLYWAAESIVFEVQYSPISAQEVEERRQDYTSLGLHLVWLLSDRRFNRWRCSAGELALVRQNHYFTSIDEKGQGEFYDQQSRVERGIRSGRSARRAIDLSAPEPLFEAIDQRTIRFQGDEFLIETSVESKQLKRQFYRSLLTALLERSVR